MLALVAVPVVPTVLEAINHPCPAPATNEIFTPRLAHQTLSFDDKIWVIGGVIVKDATGVNLNDVWFSSDGRAWQQATADASWKPRSNFGTVVFNDKMWLLGGVTFDGDDFTFLNDVWNSTNGRDWNLVTSDTPWEYAGFNPFVFKGKMWIIGRGNIDGNIFSSGNGKDWYLEGRSNKSFGGGNEAVVFEKKVWIFEQNYTDESGNIKTDESGNILNTYVWYSSDGINYTKSHLNTRNFFSVVAFQNKIWLLGGRIPPGNNYNRELISFSPDNTSDTQTFTPNWH